MTAFFVATVTIKDLTKFKEYGEKVGATIAAHGGELIIRGKAEQVLSGSANHQMTAIAKFADAATIDRWYNSDAYQAIIPVRNEGADVTLVSYTVPA